MSFLNRGQPEIQVTPRNPEFSPVVLKPLTPHNFEALGGLDHRAEEYVTVPDFEAMEQGYDHVVRSPGHLWSVHALGERALGLVGVASLWRPPNGLPTTGVMLYRDEALGTGAGSSAFVGMVSYAFDRWRAEAVVASTSSANRRCIRTLDRVGFTALQRERQEPRVVAYGRYGLRAPMTDWIVFNPDSRQSTLSFLSVTPSAVAASRRQFRTVRGEYHRIQMR